MRTEPKHRLQRAASGGFTVVPQADDEVGATPIRARHRDAVDSAFKDMVASRPTVQPGGDRSVAVSADVLRQVLESLVPHPSAREGYTQAFGDRAVEALMGDLEDFHEGTTSDPYASVAHLLRRQPKADR